MFSNAIKFTSKGGVSLHVSLLDIGRPLLCFEVRDTGIGIHRERLLTLFQPFTQADVSTSRQFGGTGLGLIISRRLAQMLGGVIVCQSFPGEGSSFIVSVDTRPLTGVSLLNPSGAATTDDGTETVHKPDPVVNSGRRLSARVLVAEDVPANQKLLRTFLEKAGATVEVAENGQEAIEEVIAAFQSGKPFDIILMDMQMPVMSGYEAASELRRRGYDVPIVAVTANAMTYEREKCIRAGCTAYVTKPINRKELIEVVAKELGTTKSEAEPTHPGEPPAEPTDFITSESEDDPEMASIVEEFFRWLPPQVEQLEELLPQVDLKEAERISHAIKGLAGTVGFMPISDVANEVVVQARNEGNAEVVRESIEELVRLCN